MNPERNIKAMLDEGRARYTRAAEKNVERGNEAAMPYGRRLLQGSLPSFVEAISKWAKATRKGTAGPNFGSARLVRSLDAEEIAFLAAKVIIDGVSTQKPYSALCMAIGEHIEDEVCFRHIKRQLPDEWAIIKRKSKEICAYARKRQMIVRVLHRDLQPKLKEPWHGWSRQDQGALGAVLLELFNETTGMLDVRVFTEGRRTKKVVAPTEGLLEWVRGFNEQWALAHPAWLPLVSPPPEWRDVWGGPIVAASYSLVKNPHGGKGYINGPLAAANMPSVYRALNLMAQTPWRINSRLLAVADCFWKAGGVAIGDLPARTVEIPMPEKPADIERNDKARKEWRAKAREVYKQNLALGSHRLQCERLLSVARRFKDVERFYFPHQLDFRGRTYAVAGFLQPQGCDLSRALLVFADTKPILHQNEADWLAIHGANLWGYDKVPFAARVEWVKTWEAEVLRCAKDPVECRWWTEADKPWEFLAFCFEWAGFRAAGWGYQASLPVQLDGSNNGLQILSLLTRDEIGGKSTNVLPGDTPQDIYQDVADAVNEELQREIDEGGPKADVAAFWLAFKVDRKAAKRPVMIMPYGGSFHACNEYVLDWFRSECKERSLNVELKEALSVCWFLADKVWKAIHSTVGRPKALMDWLHQVAGAFSDFGLTIKWTAPTGFPVHQRYLNQTSCRVETSLGERIRISLRMPTKDMDKRGQKNGFSPNFVHSLDAAALHRTVCLAEKHGVKSFAMVHDSYGVLPSDVDAIAACLRQSYASIFREDLVRKLLEELKNQLPPGVVFPPIPEYGTLDPERVLESEYFFA